MTQSHIPSGHQSQFGSVGGAPRVYGLAGSFTLATWMVIRKESPSSLGSGPARLLEPADQDPAWPACMATAVSVPPPITPPGQNRDSGVRLRDKVPFWAELGLARMHLLARPGGSAVAFRD